MHRTRKWFVVIIIAWVSLGVVVAVVRLARGEGKFFYSAKFTEFYVCEGPDTDTGIPHRPMTVVPADIEAIYACGYLEAEGKVPLYFVLFYEGRATGWLDPVEQYQSGYVSRELPQSWRTPGSYRVEVWLQRHRVASTEFSIVP
jgi:hypothetical protein